jgi:hypothetical protein
MPAINEKGVFVLADRALDRVVQQIGDDPKAAFASIVARTS